ncbi:hypothetical protein BS78_01G107900 [Paspalum vaginatum]|nr:hypothetical protein BS78_01G107900 [Paspalum vaginatum]
MGRRLDVLLGRTTKQTARLKALLGLAATRLGVVRGHRQVRCAQAGGDVEQLLRLGHQDRALARAEHVVRERNAVDVLVDLDAYCGLIVERAALLDTHRDCPEELREAAAGLVYAAARCGDLPELQEVRGILAAKFGREFVAAASELRSGCGVNPKIVQKLSTKQPSLESRQMVLQEIAAEKGIAVSIYQPPLDDSGRSSSNHNHRKTKHGEERNSRMPQVDDLDEDVSGGSAQRYKDVETAAQAAFKSAASAAAAAKAAVELSRGEPRGPGHGRMDHESKEGDEMLDGKRFDKIGDAQNYSSEIEVLQEDNDMKRHEQRDPARGKPASVRTKRGF